MPGITLALDTTPPLLPSLALVGLDGGVITLTSDQVVMAKLTCSATPAELLGEYKIWGDVDPTAYGAVQGSELASSWVTYSDPLIPLRLSAGAAVKSLYGRLRDDLRNQTPVLSVQVVYDPDYPSVQVVMPPDRTSLSQAAGYRTCTFDWTPSVDVVQYQVRVVPSLGSSAAGGSPVGVLHGSTNVAATGAFLAGAPVHTSIDAADLEAASPGDGQKFVKVYVRDSAGRWSL